MKGKNRIEIEGLPKNSLARDTWRRLLSNKAAVFGSIIMILIILMAIFADVLYDYETQVIAMALCEAQHNSVYLIMVVMRRTDVKTAPGEDSWRSCFT